MSESMTNQVRDQISAFLDDELSADESAFLVRRLERDEDARRSLVRYALIGAAIKGELLRPDPDLLRRRVALRLDGGYAAPRPVATPPMRRDRWPLVGLGSAAALGLLALVLLRFDADGVGDPAGPESAPVAAVTDAAAPRPEFATVGATRRAVLQTSAQQPIRFTNYLVHHGEFASRIGRPWIHSTVVSSREFESQPQIEDASWRQ
jgi:anti-sigma factor RsiW